MFLKGLAAFGLVVKKKGLYKNTPVRKTILYRRKNRVPWGSAFCLPDNEEEEDILVKIKVKDVMHIIKNLVMNRGISAVMAIRYLNLATGDPVSVFAPEVIAHVYGVEAKVSNDNGRPNIMPVRSVISPELKLRVYK